MFELLEEPGAGEAEFPVDGGFGGGVEFGGFFCGAAEEVALFEHGGLFGVAAGEGGEEAVCGGMTQDTNMPDSSLTDPRWVRIQEIFDLASGWPAGEQGRRLAEVEGDELLRERRCRRRTGAWWCTWI